MPRYDDDDACTRVGAGDGFANPKVHSVVDINRYSSSKPT